jgi:hypothetical protein
MQIAELSLATQFVAASAIRRFSPYDLAADMRTDIDRPRFDL